MPSEVRAINRRILVVDTQLVRVFVVVGIFIIMAG